jgi:hypothetical protein
VAQAAHVIGLWLTYGFGYWAVERKSDGLLVGQVGLAELTRDMQPSIEGCRKRDGSSPLTRRARAMHRSRERGAPLGRTRR